MTAGIQNRKHRKKFSSACIGFPLRKTAIGGRKKANIYNI